VAIESFEWTAHALLRLGQRHLTRSDVEQAIREAHDERRPNDGAADWLIAGTTTLGVSFEAIYDHPSHGDETTARIVSAWRVS
jgi:Domain of unknown function (DUF4258)